MNEKPFEIVSHTADIAVVVRGQDMQDLFRNAARALTSVLVGDQMEIGHGVERTVNLDSTDVDALLIDWLNELVFYADAEQLVFSDFHFDDVQDGHLSVVCWGERLEASRNLFIREVKAATYHGSHISQTDNGYTARIVFDV